MSGRAWTPQALQLVGSFYFDWSRGEGRKDFVYLETGLES